MTVDSTAAKDWSESGISLEGTEATGPVGSTATESGAEIAANAKNMVLVIGSTTSASIKSEIWTATHAAIGSGDSIVVKV